MPSHFQSPPDPIPESWDLLLEGVAFTLVGSFTSQDLRDVADDLPAAFNTHSVVHFYGDGDTSVVGYAKAYDDRDSEEYPLDANVDWTHGVWNGMWNGLEDAGFTINTWWFVEHYLTDRTETAFGETRGVDEYFYTELDPPSSQG